ncbi:hypothetical protein R6242_14260 [Iodobacter sp. CM08]|uniref:hypothetical protein n=1 Tax=Iodobacter sp. CM08 TaxID=3085902 RepID=UPI0029813876|nr:hypothetical protein [Iodobacter sp. CM08]MDW5417730.1 hypothetical protein [Iodobacter sp. CM08]
MNTEIESRLNQLTGNIMGLQTLVLAVVATSGRSQLIAEYLQKETLVTLANLNAESTQADETLQRMEYWLRTTIDLLLSDEISPAAASDTSAILRHP